MGCLDLEQAVTTARELDRYEFLIMFALLPVEGGTDLEREMSQNRILGPHRIDALNERGIDIQVLSANQYWWYRADPELARDIIRAQDDGIAEWVAAHPDRFVALTSVALQHPELAAEPLEGIGGRCIVNLEAAVGFGAQGFDLHGSGSWFVL